MFYDVTDKVKGIAKIEGVSVDKVIAECGIKWIGGEITARSRGEEAVVLRRLSELKDDIKKIESEKARLAGYHWIKEDGKWVAAGDFTGKKEGATITVSRKDGSKQIKMIKGFSSNGNAFVN